MELWRSTDQLANVTRPTNLLTMKLFGCCCFSPPQRASRTIPTLLLLHYLQPRLVLLWGYFLSPILSLHMLSFFPDVLSVSSDVFVNFTFLKVWGCVDFISMYSQPTRICFSSGPTKHMITLLVQHLFSHKAWSEIPPSPSTFKDTLTGTGSILRRRIMYLRNRTPSFGPRTSGGPSYLPPHPMDIKRPHVQFQSFSLPFEWLPLPSFLRFWHFAS